MIAAIKMFDSRICLILGLCVAICVSLQIIANYSFSLKSLPSESSDTLSSSVDSKMLMNYRSTRAQGDISAARICLLSKFGREAKSLPRKRVYSQFEEDGIIESIYDCIKEESRYFVEFGVQDGEECTTRYLREEKNWTGLMMDGGFEDTSINLHNEFIYANNIVALFVKYGVPERFDHLTVDVDLITFWLARQVLAGGYRPRTLTVEFNRNFRTLSDSYSTLYLPEATWDSLGKTCYYGASALAFVRMLSSFGYHLVSLDRVGINMFFVHMSEVGSESLVSLTDALRLANKGKDYPLLHHDCNLGIPWVYIPDNTDFNNPRFYNLTFPAINLTHTNNPDGTRVFSEEPRWDAVMSKLGEPTGAEELKDTKELLGVSGVLNLLGELLQRVG